MIRQIHSILKKRLTIAGSVEKVVNNFRRGKIREKIYWREKEELEAILTMFNKRKQQHVGELEIFYKSIDKP